jgi:polyhydroxyalkanoate synthase
MFEQLLQRGERLAKVEANRALLRFVNGIEWLVRDPKAVVGRTPYDVVFKRDKLEVRRYHLGSVKPRYAVPVLLIPPLMVKPFIFDLVPERSLVAHLLKRGFAVYLVDFGEPDDADAFVSLDNYVLDWMPAAVQAVKQDSGSRHVSLLGYCMGGIFALTHTAANHDRSVRNIVCIGAPVDMSKMGLFAWLSKLAGNQVESLARRIGNVPGGLSSTVFRMLTPMKNVTRYADLFMNMWSHEYVNGFDAMNQWVGQFIDYPQAAFVQFNKEIMQRNKLVKGQLAFRGKIADLHSVEASLLVFAGATDQVAPAPAVKALLDKVRSRDKTFHLVPGGHMGVFAGASAPVRVWDVTADWLAKRSGRSLAALPPRRRESRPAPRRAATRKPVAVGALAVGS